MSKGSKDRVSDKKQFDENYENIDWNDGLPTLRSLYGAAPDRAGGLDSVAYVRWHREQLLGRIDE